MENKMLPKLLEKKFLILWLALLLSAILATNVNAVDIATGRMRVKHNVECYIPYLSNIPIDGPNANVTHLILGIHASGHNTYSIFNSCVELLGKYNKQQNNVMVLAPQFLTSVHVEKNSEKNLLYWGVSPFYGSVISTTKAFDGDLRISAYHVLENIISDYCDKTIFPNLNRITILGHSAGGQLVNRFSASNTVEFDKAKPQNVHIRYVVMNPSSYVYMSPKRSVRWSMKDYAVPSETLLETIDGYNSYSYGLEHLYSYHRSKGLTPEKIRELFSQRNIVYLLGQKDCTQGGSLSMTIAAKMQGRNRLERGKLYFGHLIDEFGSEIQKKQELHIVKGVGHNGRGMMLSPPGRIAILSEHHDSAADDNIPAEMIKK